MQLFYRYSATSFDASPQMICNKRRLALGVVLMIILFLVNAAFARGVLDRTLAQKMAGASGPFQVIVTFQRLDQVNSLSTLGVLYHPLTTLPMAGAMLTTGQINQVLEWPTVESVYYNDRLTYFHHGGGELPEAQAIQASLRSKGKGITILVLDSGIDTAHQHKVLGGKLIENIRIASDLEMAGRVEVAEAAPSPENTGGNGALVFGSTGGLRAVREGDTGRTIQVRRVVPGDSLEAGGTLLILHTLVAFDYAMANHERFGIDIICSSWGNTNSRFDPHHPVSKASYEAYRRGMVVIFAAGNAGPDDDSMSAFAINPWVIGVAAGDRGRNVADFSSRGEAGDRLEHPDITAPGFSMIAADVPVSRAGAGRLNHPLHHPGLDGTSMASSFVAGVAAMLLEANPDLSPDQIEELLLRTADPMSGCDFHQAGAGYISVLPAMHMAQTISGNRSQFLAGDTKWSSRGDWVSTEEDDAGLAYSGKWKTVPHGKASSGSYKVGLAKGICEIQKPMLRVIFLGRAIKLSHPTNAYGGVAEVLIDGESRGTISFNSTEPQWNVRSAVAGLADTNHTLEVRGVTGRVYLDRIHVDGRLLSANTEFAEEAVAFNGTVGPSLAGFPVMRLIPFEVSERTIQINADLRWSPAGDLDLSLLDPQGQVVASDAALSNPEVVTYWVGAPGTYTYQIAAFTSVAATYTLNSVQVKAVASNSRATGVSGTGTPAETPKEFALFPSHPNPFNPEATIGYHLPRDARVTLKVFDLNGREVVLLCNGRQPAGRHGASFVAKDLPSGIYFCRIEVNDVAGNHFTKVNRLVLLK